VTDTDEIWGAIDAALNGGNRGLPDGSSLAKLLAAHRCVRNIMDLPPLTVDQILSWADEHKTATGDWPKKNSGQVTGRDETWAGIQDSLLAGRRDLVGGSSLAKLLAEHRGVRNHMDLPDLTIEQIGAWADAHNAATGDWPNQKSGQVTGTDETWAAICAALNRGHRGLPRGCSLANLLAEYRGVRNVQNLPPLTVKQILEWIDMHKAATGDWPRKDSRQVTGTDETWAGLNTALNRGTRGLTGGCSLTKLLAKHRGVRNVMDLPNLTVEQILQWMDAHKAATGDWPRKDSGQATGADETWAGLNSALNRGTRGLTGGSSLAKLLAEHRSVRNVMDLPQLTVEQILECLDSHKAATGTWPRKDSGQVTGADETWAGLNTALNRGTRGLTGGSSLARLIKEHRSNVML
jgi:hypothetical protein